VDGVLSPSMLALCPLQMKVGCDVIMILARLSSSTVLLL
jgi:hypothetical protein